MSFFRHILIFLSFLSGWNLKVNLFAQNQLNCNTNFETIADSIALREEHDKAVEIYQKVLIQKDKNITQEEKNRLNYKIGNSLMQNGKEKQAQPLFQKIGGKAMAQRVDGDFFLMPQAATTAFIAACAPPLSMGVLALRTCSGVPTGLGNNNRGWRCSRHEARNAW